MVKINPKTNQIELTRGDTLKLRLNLKDANGDPYIPGITDEIRFAMKQNYSDAEVLVTAYAVVDGENITITIPAADTKELAFGSYKYDIQLTTSDGVVDTFINKAAIRITEEVD